MQKNFKTRICNNCGQKFEQQAERRYFVPNIVEKSIKSKKRKKLDLLSCGIL